MILYLMQILYFLLMASILLSCSDRSRHQLPETSYWVKLKDSFATKNLVSFVVDSQLKVTYIHFQPVKNRVVDSVISYGKPYLYSWQENDFGLTTFTTFVYDREHGSRIIYFIFDKTDSLRSTSQVANKAGEAGIIFETQTKFLTKDTLLKISSATTQWDLSKSDPWSHPLRKSKGDSTFFHLIVLKEGQIIEKKIAEKKELNPHCSKSFFNC